ncbi:MAG TPA: terminase family protein, partial [Methylomirabilota bacterium]|nr:terminase family protein [Methylomirabilota bacterium]
VGYILWYILFNPHVTAALAANKEDTALELLSKAHLAYLHLPLFLQQGIVEWNKGSIALENGSRVIADATSVDSMSGYTINLLVIDEVAKIDNWEEFSASIIPTISSGETTKIVQISTPKGLNHFYKSWINAQPGAKHPNGYHPIMVHWKEVPGRDENWRVNALAELNNDEDKFAQEYDCEFLGSSGTLIAGWKLKELMTRVNSVTPLAQSKDLIQFEAPKAKHVYSITCDVSEGKAFDYHVANVIDCTVIPYNQVCVYRSNEASPAEFAQILNELGHSYNMAMILIEFESLGAQVAGLLFEEYDYENLISTKAGGSFGIHITTESGKTVNRGGVKMTQTIRRNGGNLAKLMIEQDKLLINDFNTASEFCTFSREDGKVKFEAEKGCYDDAVMTVLIFAWMSDQEYFRENTNIYTVKKLREMDETSVENELIPFGFIDKGPEVIPQQSRWEPNDIMYKNKEGNYVSWLVYDDDDKPNNF